MICIRYNNAVAMSKPKILFFFSLSTVSNIAFNNCNNFGFNSIISCQNVKRRMYVPQRIVIGELEFKTMFEIISNYHKPLNINIKSIHIKINYVSRFNQGKYIYIDILNSQYTNLFEEKCAYFCSNMINYVSVNINI